MDVIVIPIAKLQGNIQALPSKNYTTRYLLAAALATGISTIYSPARSEDSSVMCQCIQDLGALLIKDKNKIIVTGFGNQPKLVNKKRTLDVGNAGAVLRFLMGIATLLPQINFLNTYPQSLGKRPHHDLIYALEQMGIQVKHREGKLPLTIYGGKPRGGEIFVSGKMSSQYISSLLFLTPLLQEDSIIEVTSDLKSKVALTQTLDVLTEAGIYIEAQPDFMHFRVPGKQQYVANQYVVQGDYPGSAAILAAAAIIHSDVTIYGLTKNSKQGERAVIDVLRQMKVAIEHVDSTVHIRGNGCLQAVEVDGDMMTDAVLALVAAAVFAEGTSRFYNIENIRFKECDRITDYVTELKKAGADVEERQAEIIVHGCPEGIQGGVEMEAHYDHRVIMALTIIGLRSRQPIFIKNAHHISKSYPHFFGHLRMLGAKVDNR